MLLLATAASSWIRPPGQRVPARQSLATSFQSALAAVCAKAPWDPPYDVVPGRVEDEGSEEVAGNANASAEASAEAAGVWRSPLANELVGLLLALLLGLSPVWTTLAVSQAISAYAIPSRSMDSTLKVGDVVLAEKISSLLHLPLERGDLVFFEPPDRLAAIVADSGVRLGARDRFVKRVAAVAGDVVQLDDSGRGVIVNGVPRQKPTLACSDQPPSPPPAPAPSASASVQAPPAAPAATVRVPGLVALRTDSSAAAAVRAGAGGDNQGTTAAAAARAGGRGDNQGTRGDWDQAQALSRADGGRGEPRPQANQVAQGTILGKRTLSLVAQDTILGKILLAEADPEVLQRLQALLDAGRIDNYEAAALLREVSPPERERAEGAAEYASTSTRRRIFGAEQKAVDPEQLGVTRVIPPGTVFVLGDCEARSSDSRAWGPLEVNQIRARPVVRVWPPDRFGAIETTEDLNPFRRLREAYEKETAGRPWGEYDIGDAGFYGDAGY